MSKKGRKYLNVIFALVMFLLPLAGCGCSGDPMPQPPTFEYDLVSIERNDETDSVTITGREGAADPSARLQFYNFNLSADLFAAYEIDAAGDGSFQVTMPGWKINNYRVVGTVGGETGSVDFHGNFDGSVTIVDDPIYGCFHISDLFIDFGEVVASPDQAFKEFRAVEMTNECERGYVIKITDVYLSDRENFADFHSISPDPRPVPFGQTEQIGVQFSPVETGEMFKFLQVQFGEFDRVTEVEVKSYDLKIILKGNGVENP